ncbi:MAG: glycogen debranching protein [Proteobacteria bacterium ST_bin12]|nr:MAG: glycogen debranching protein [Proteobacteria bacterium ST_bin12]
MNITLPTYIQFGREICGDLLQSERREWWLANGLGGYAAGNIAGTLTRRYHGLLVAPVNPPLGRHLVFAKGDATLIVGDKGIPLFSNRWGDGSVSPAGYLQTESFHLEGRMPVWRFAIGDIRIEQRIWMEQDANTTYLAYRLLSSGAASTQALKLSVKLLVNSRDHHGSGRPWEFNPFIESEVDALYVRNPNWFTLTVKTRGGKIEPDMTWYDNFHLSAERERGLPDSDSHLCIGEALLELNSDEWVGIVASTEHNPSSYISDALRRNMMHEAGQFKRLQATVPEFIGAPDWVNQLALSSSSFIFARPSLGVPNGESIIAGYPWFGDWGRDTMIALPGLTLTTGRYETALRILNTFAKFIDQGMLPNVFPGVGELPEYNTVDAALWYIEAWRAYVAATGEKDSLKQVFPILVEMIDWHVKGTRYQIHVDPADGLLYAGEPGVQITWMDAKVGDFVVTPRIGKPVEINALWYNALVAMGEFATMLKLPATQYLELAEKAKTGFSRFIKADATGLVDVLDGPDGDDYSLRPNQIFAVSLHASPLDAKTQREVVEICGRELLTSYGLRSLNVAHPEFKPHYEGGVWGRDTSYHQGPVWAFLLGHYALAEFKVTGDALAAQAKLEPMRDHLTDAALGTVSEIFDGVEPHTPRGAPAQAWSVACTLEAWVYLERKKNEKMRVLPVVKKEAPAVKVKVAV